LSSSLKRGNSSRTHRAARLIGVCGAKLTDEESADAGFFKPTAIVREAWEVTAACARALRAKRVLFQCPASFTPTRENIANMERFFSSVDREISNFVGSRAAIGATRSSAIYARGLESVACR
jgi:uncharacterized protein YecE (DUF72 family)